MSACIMVDMYTVALRTALAVIPKYSGLVSVHYVIVMW